MRRSLILAGLVAALALALPAAAVAQKTTKPADKKTPGAPKTETKEQKLAGGKFTGTVVSVEGSQKTLTVQMTLQVPVVNRDEVNAVQAWQVELAKAKDVNRAAECQRNIAYHSQRVYSFQEKKENVDLQTIENVKVRTANPPTAFDD